MNTNISHIKTPYSIEKSLDKMITSTMKGESYRSPLTNHPKYLQDELSRLILLGNKNYAYGYPDINLQREANYFNGVQHKYLNKNLWNINEENTGRIKNYPENSAENNR
jgi:hypothetical protein